MMMCNSIRGLCLWLALQLLFSAEISEAQKNRTPNDLSSGGEAEGLLYSSSCGRPMARRSRVVGGEDVYDGEFPWLVSIQLLPALGENKCGGTILNDRWILTAAHCFHGYSKSNFVVRVADYNLRRKEMRPQQAMTVAIEKLVVHPHYRKDRKYDNDIALIKLAKDIEFSPYSLPACLPTLRLASTAGRNVTVIGWGKLAESGKLPETPRKTSLIVFDNAQCNDWLASLRMRLLDNHLCAGVSKGGRDACQGDSGGPLMAVEDGRYVVVGVVSTGYGCARPKTPGVYARVSSFLPWINNVIN